VHPDSREIKTKTLRNCFQCMKKSSQEGDSVT
jgi:hypothetical protein